MIRLPSRRCKGPASIAEEVTAATSERFLLRTSRCASRWSLGTRITTLLSQLADQDAATCA
jgi:hypothetical protein